MNSLKFYKILEIIGLIGMFIAYYFVQKTDHPGSELTGVGPGLVGFCLFFTFIGVVFTLSKFYRTGWILNFIGAFPPLIILLLFIIRIPFAITSQVATTSQVSILNSLLSLVSIIGAELLFLLPLLGSSLMLWHISKGEKVKDKQKTVNRIEG
jgi:hypothetical protein